MKINLVILVLGDNFFKILVIIMLTFNYLYIMYFKNSYLPYLRVQ